MQTNFALDDVEKIHALATATDADTTTLTPLPQKGCAKYIDTLTRPCTCTTYCWGTLCCINLGIGTYQCCCTGIHCGWYTRNIGLGTLYGASCLVRYCSKAFCEKKYFKPPVAQDPTYSFNGSYCDAQWTCHKHPKDFCDGACRCRLCDTCADACGGNICLTCCPCWCQPSSIEDKK